MTDLQVLLDPRGATRQELSGSVRTLLLQVPHVEVVEPTDSQLADLLCSFGSRVSRAGGLRTGVPVLVASGRVCWAAGSVRRVLTELATPGRSLTRVLVEGLSISEGRVACWAPEWVSRFAGSLEELVDADLDFDRRHLPHDSPLARSWVRADAIGLVPVAEAGADPVRWARIAGGEVATRSAVAAVRGPLGAARRRLARRRQRRAHATQREL